MAQDDKKPDPAPQTAKNPKHRHGLGLGELTSMMTGHSTRDPDTTEPGDKTTGPGELGNFLKNQKE